MEKLKPCPFCGCDKPEAYAINPGHTFIVTCPACGAGSSYEDSQEKANEAWNRRHTAAREGV